MNDFTKEELREIYWVFDRQGACRLLTLKEKIQSMIDNYCEHEIMTSDMKENQAICVFNENGKTYLTLTSDIFACGTHASLDLAHKIICSLAIGNNKFSNEWIDRIIFRLQELKNDNQ